MPPPDGLHTTLGTPSHFSKFKKNVPGGSSKVADILQKAADKSCRKMSQQSPDASDNMSKSVLIKGIRFKSISKVIQKRLEASS